ncbi:MAG: DUF1326 domain-containing protein [Planctomycetales bacterium]|nr:DUF1326 domain-containing protein [Planctomycetales bacterium]
MHRSHFLAFLGAVGVAAILSASQVQAEVTGTYIEARTCQVYTGPCFANGEVGLAGKEALLAWNIESGSHGGTELAGLNVLMIVKAEDTIGFTGLAGARPIAATLLLDERATPKQRDALADFAQQHVGLSSDKVVRVDVAPIAVALDIGELTGRVEAGSAVQLTTRKARKSDCICSNESAYYPPIVKLENFAPGVTIDGQVRARGLGSRWDVSGNRNVYMATFAY